MTLYEIRYEGMLEDVRSGRGRQYGREYEIQVVAVSRDSAALRVLSELFVDHLHVGRFRDRWLVVNVLYERR